MSEEVLPFWAQHVIKKNHALELSFFMFKRIEASDLSMEDNLFHLHHHFMQPCLAQYLTAEEVYRSNLSLVDANAKAKLEYDHEGLSVSVYIQGGWRVELQLTHSIEKKCAVLKGNEMEILRKFGNYKENDNLAVWMFRLPKENSAPKLCFILVKPGLLN